MVDEEDPSICVHPLLPAVRQGSQLIISPLRLVRVVRQRGGLAGPRVDPGGRLVTVVCRWERVRGGEGSRARGHNDRNVVWCGEMVQIILAVRNKFDTVIDIKYSTPECVISNQPSGQSCFGMTPQVAEGWFIRTLKKKSSKG